MDDRYPSTDGRQGVQLDFEYPDAANGLNRWLPLVKWFLAIPTSSCCCSSGSRPSP